MVPLFQLKNLSFVDGGRVILDHVNINFVAGGITCLVGPSGSGKTSLLRLLNRLDVPSAGTISYQGKPLDDINPLELRRRVAMVFQRPPLFPGTVADNLRVAASNLDTEALLESLNQVHLDVEVDRNVDTLSGGEAQRLCLARALLTGPEVILADEPTSSLDQHATAGIETLLTELAEEDMTVIMVSHDLAQMTRLANRVAIIERGRILAHDELESVQASDNPDVQRTIRSVQS